MSGVITMSVGTWPAIFHQDNHTANLFSNLQGESFDRPVSFASLAFASIVIVVCGFALTQALYNVFLHPLRSYPGPWLAKVTPAYAAYRSLRGDIHLDLKRLHAIYGDVIRYAPNRLVFNSKAALEDIYGFGKPVKKSSSYATMVPWEDGWTVASLIDKHLHRKMRRTLSHGISTEALRRFEPTVVAQLDILTQMITEKKHYDDEWSSPQDMSRICKRFGVDAMAQLGYGQSTGLLQRPESCIINTMDQYTLRTGFFEQWPGPFHLGIEKFFNTIQSWSPASRKFSAWREKFENETMDKNGQSKRGIFSHVVQGLSESGSRSVYHYTSAQMRAEGGFTLLVGSDTNTAALAAALFYLSRFPDARQRLENEIFEAIPDISDVSCLSPSPLASLPFLDAVAMEVLRMCPPTPGVPWREVEEGGMCIAGQHIPAGTDVGTCIWEIQRSVDIFRDPDRFWPERWLPGTLPEEELKLATSCNKPFSMGPRACAGKQVAIMLLKVALVKILWHCEMHVPEGSLGKIGEGDGQCDVAGRREKNDFQFKMHFSAVTHGPWLQFKPRDRP